MNVLRHPAGNGIHGFGAATKLQASSAGSNTPLPSRSVSHSSAPGVREAAVTKPLRHPPPTHPIHVRDPKKGVFKVSADNSESGRPASVCPLDREISPDKCARAAGAAEDARCMPPAFRTDAVVTTTPDVRPPRLELSRGEGGRAKVAVRSRGGNVELFLFIQRFS